MVTCSYLLPLFFGRPPSLSRSGANRRVSDWRFVNMVLVLQRECVAYCERSGLYAPCHLNAVAAQVRPVGQIRGSICCKRLERRRFRRSLPEHFLLLPSDAQEIDDIPFIGPQSRA